MKILSILSPGCRGFFFALFFFSSVLWASALETDSLLLVQILSKTPNSTYINPDLPVEFWQGVDVDSGRVIFLDLSYCELDSVPAEVWLLSGLRSLYLPHNNISYLPSDIKNLTRLRFLNLGYNSFDGIPSILRELREIISFNFSGNNLLEIDSILQFFPKIEVIAFEDNKLKAIPEYVYSCTTLTAIFISHNEVGELSPKIGDLLHLAYLDVRNNQLARLPDELSNLQEITTIKAQANKITQLPEDIGFIGFLTDLYLDTNELTNLPESVTDRDWTFFSVNYNKLKRDSLSSHLVWWLDTYVYAWESHQQPSSVSLIGSLRTDFSDHLPIQYSANRQRLISNDPKFNEVEIFNAQGKKLCSPVLINGESSQDIPLTKGVYFYRVLNEENIGRFSVF